MKYKDRYVLATGYPWGLGAKKNITAVRMDATSGLGATKKIAWPVELWDPEMPRYRLVLERVKKGEGLSTP